MKNPFTPSFGQVPLQMAGRTEIIEKMQVAFENGVGDPNLCTLFTGARGTGKTALLQLLARQAEQAGWISVSVTAVSGMLEDAYEQTVRKTRDLVDSEGGTRLKSVSVGQFLSVEFERREREVLNWRSRMSDILDALAEVDVGLLITVDEVDPELEDVIRLSTVYQHFIGEDRKVSLVMAGLPHRISTLLNGKSISFLRRANRVGLGRIGNADVKDAFAQTVEAGGKAIGADALDAAAHAIDGFPFMLQLVGYYTWNAASGEMLGAEDVGRGAMLAKEEMETRVLDATLAELSGRDLDFLQAMLRDAETSKTVDIASRIGMSTGNVSTYKKRLLEQGVIEEARRGEVKFALPYLREYLPEYCA